MRETRRPLISPRSASPCTAAASARPPSPNSLVRGYPPPRSGSFNVGVLHTSLDGREGHARYAPTSVAELAARGYDYWALGHVHAYEEVSQDPWMVFPGNLQGRNVRETGPKGAVLVEVADALRVAHVERLVLDEARWAALFASPALQRSLLGSASVLRASFR